MMSVMMSPVTIPTWHKCAQCGKDDGDYWGQYGRASGDLHRGVCEAAWMAAAISRTFRHIEPANPRARSAVS
jgi:hypothetical protein